MHNNDSKNETVAVVIPTYSAQLNEYEKISLQQVHDVLTYYDKIFLAPASLKFDYGEKYSSYPICRFDDSWFKDTSSYSGLMLSEEFYSAFSEYKYILIYQLDALVFFDGLEGYCKLGYDYIGSPALGRDDSWGLIGRKVGNGGFSLRNVKACINALKKGKYLFRQGYLKHILRQQEDLFFSYMTSQKCADFKAPTVALARKFSLDFAQYDRLKPLGAYKQVFGCHNWNKHGYYIWKPLVEKLGYTLVDKKEAIDDVERPRRRRAKKYWGRRRRRELIYKFAAMLPIPIDPKSVYQTLMWLMFCFHRQRLSVLATVRKKERKKLFLYNLANNYVRFLRDYYDVFYPQQVISWVESRLSDKILIGDFFVDDGTDGIRHDKNDWRYFIVKDKHIYLKKDFSEDECTRYVRKILIEQNEFSPLHYDFTSEMCHAGAVMDFGAQSGVFACEAINQAKKMYIAETDGGWIEALKRTFANYPQATFLTRESTIKMMGNSTKFFEFITSNCVALLKINLSDIETQSLLIVEPEKFPECLRHLIVHLHGNNKIIQDLVYTLQHAGYCTVLSSGVHDVVVYANRVGDCW